MCGKGIALITAVILFSMNVLVAIERESTLRLIFASAVLFAIGSVSLFFVILMQNPRGVEMPGNRLTMEEKMRILGTLDNASEEEAGVSAASSSVLVPTPQNADPADRSAAEKLRILESLNAE